MPACATATGGIMSKMEAEHSMQNFTKRPEPVMNRGLVAALLITFVKAGVAFGTAVDVLQWDSAQQSAFNAFAIAGIDVAIVLIVLWRGRGKVTPVEDARDDAGRKLEAESNETT